MDEYRKLLILAYFEQFEERYILNDLIRIIGISYKRFEILLQELKEEQLIRYTDGILGITEKGRRVIISNDMNSFSYLDKNYLDLNINKSRAWGFDKPYVPIKFMNKI